MTLSVVGGKVTKQPKAKQNTCGSCGFARPLSGNDKAISCQRNPPTVTKVEGAQITAHWPLLGVENWCGEYQKRA